MKTVLITGAYRGLGFEAARQLSERGWKVIVTARRRGRGSAAAAKLPNTSFLELDITDGRSVSRAAEEVSELDVLINNAAIIADGDQDVVKIQPSIVARTIAAFAEEHLRPDCQRFQRCRAAQRHGNLVTSVRGFEDNLERHYLPAGSSTEGQKYRRQFRLPGLVPH